LLKEALRDAIPKRGMMQSWIRVGAQRRFEIIILCGTLSLAAAFHRLPALVAQLIFLPSKTVENHSTSAATANARAKFSGIVTAGPTVLRAISVLGERHG